VRVQIFYLSRSSESKAACAVEFLKFHPAKYIKEDASAADESLKRVCSGKDFVLQESG
jgi:hypothetical protein